MSSNRPQIRLILSLAALAATGLLGACASSEKPAPVEHAAAATPTQQYPLRAREIPGELKLAVHAEGLSPSQRDALADMADRWTQSGGGDVTVRVPTAGVDQRAADLTSREAVDFLGAMGVPEVRIRRVGYAPAAQGDAQNRGEAPIVVAYLTYRAMIQRCGLEWENLSTNGKNRPMKNFGCAVSSNMAAQIADPADIAAPRTLDPTDTGRRVTVLDKYRQGQGTGGDADRNANGTLSSIGGSN